MYLNLSPLNSHRPGELTNLKSIVSIETEEDHLESVHALYHVSSGGLHNAL